MDNTSAEERTRATHDHPVPSAAVSGRHVVYSCRRLVDHAAMLDRFVRSLTMAKLLAMTAAGRGASTEGMKLS